jgi:hypothetical protein
MRVSTIFMQRVGVLIFLLSLRASAQFTYTIDQSVPVEINGVLINMPWAGGLNSAQVSTIDLNSDGNSDLVIFDRASGTISTFLRVNNSWQYSPDHAQLFPPDISHWMLLRDFNCDGKKDLFTSHPFGISVFVNTTKTGQPLSWRSFNPGFPLLTKGFSGTINLKVNEADLPSIDDVDGDGDLDILNMRFTGPGTVEWHRNMSVENTGKCDSLQMERITQNYGNFEECSCGIFAFGQTCQQLAGGGRVAHSGGKNMLAIDLDNDGDRELIFSEESCNRLYVLQNSGTAASATYAGLALFPFSTVSVPLFPAAYHEDVDFDGKADLIVSPNVYARSFSYWLVNNSVLLYRNSGTVQQPSFTFVKNNFLQDQMVEVGDYSVPTFADTDGDGDDDMLIGYYGQNFIGGIQHYENTGTGALPSFRRIAEDYFGLSALNHYNFKPQAVDMNGDGKVDIAYTSTSLQSGITTLQYLRNDDEDGISYTGSSWTDTGFRIGQAENLYVIDVNLDGRRDFLIGKSSGAVEYWENTDPNGGYSAMMRKNSAYLGISTSTSRLNPVVTVGDLDGDGLHDLILANQRGGISIYPDFRHFKPQVDLTIEEVIHNEFLDVKSSVNLGGRIWPVIVNLFNSDKPAIVVGNTTGGLRILRNREGSELPEEPVITVFPNPLVHGDSLNVLSDRPAEMQVFSTLGQKMCEPIPVPANQSYPVALNHLASGMYIARFLIKGKNYSRRFILY